MTEDIQQVFIVDDDRSVRTSLARLLHSAGYEAKVFSSATEFLQRRVDDGVACLILDVMMPGISGISLQRQLAAKRSNLPIIFLSGHGDLPMVVRAMQRGAEDFLQKPVDETILLNAVSKAMARCESITNEELDKFKLASALDTLTTRELEILQLILGVATNAQIADFSDISEKTVKAHRGKIMQKTGAASAAELGWICSSSQLTAKKVQASSSQFITGYPSTARHRTKVQ